MTDSLFDLSGRVALVTGSTQGLGEATARLLGQQGAHVVISSRHRDRCEEVAGQFRKEGIAASAIACHIGRQDDIDALFGQVTEQHGRLDVLVNNAVLSPWRSIEETERALILKSLEVNIAGYWAMSIGAVQLMKAQGKGSIVNISSTASRISSKGLGLYSTFKSSLDGMTRSFAYEFGGGGIRVNTILAGLFATSLADAFSPEQKRDIIDRIPLGRAGHPQELASAVLFLASDASAYVTGTNLVVDGGRLTSG